MTRKLTLVAGVLFTTVSAGSLLAQTSAAPKPASSSSSMQHATAPKSAQQDSTTAHATTHKMKHAVWTKDQVKEAQEGLAKAGFYKGQPTGVVDRRTRKAIRAYQKANKLPVTGRLDNDLLTRLHSS